jgi:iron complex transport system permease protein
VSLALQQKTRRRHPRLLGTCLVLIAMLAILMVASIALGSRLLSPEEFFSLFGSTQTPEIHTLVWEVRAPRTLAAVLVGCSLAWAGTVMQSITRNPLADPGLLGVSAGAALAVTIAMSFMKVSSAIGIAAAALLGAAVITAAVLVVGLSRGGDRTRLILAGVAFSLTVLGIQSGLALLNPLTLDAMRAWSVGSIASPNRDVIALAAPIILAGLTISLLLSRPLDALALGDDLAHSLGSHPNMVRAVAGIATVCLVGGATAIAGPISFVGLMIPHIIRPFTSSRTVPLLLAASFAGAGLLLFADTVARLVIWPGELPVGVVASAIGAPLLLIFARRRG